MNHLLTVADERELTQFLSEEIGAKLLLSDVAPKGVPEVAVDPLAALPASLPTPPKFGVHQIIYLTFWLPDCGDVKTRASARPAVSAFDRVARLLTCESAEAAGVDDADIIDFECTPIIQLGRSHQYAANRLAPGFLYSMHVKRASLPEPALKKFVATERWLKRRGVKTDPFQHCVEVQTRRPQNLGRLWVCVQPHAMARVRQGTEIWPWNA